MRKEDLYMEIDIDTLRELSNIGHIKFTAHILSRLQEREIYPSDIRHCIRTGHIIEAYPKDYPFPSCLVLGCTLHHKPLHVVIGVGEGYLWLITAYFPNPAKWDDNFSQRKEQ